jgi:hypothetical protein
MTDDQVPNEDASAPYDGPSGEIIAQTLREALGMLKNGYDDTKEILGASVAAALVALFQEELDAITEHLSGSDGEPAAVAVSPCRSETCAADLAQALLDEYWKGIEEAPAVEIPENGGAAMVELHVRGQHVSLSKEFDTLPELAVGLDDMATKVRGLIKE